MTMHHAALLAGLFLVPLAALLLGHRLARRPARQRALFWGIVVGHTAAALVASVAALHLPVRWSDADLLRGLLGFWAMPLGGVVGGAIGWVAGGRDGHHEPGPRR
jgi:hypothetical protein